MSQEKSSDTREVMTQLPNEHENWFWVLRNNTRNRVFSNLEEPKRILGSILDWIKSGVDLTDSLKQYFNDTTFLSEVNRYVWENLTTVLTKSSVYTFDEISSFITILWMGKYHEIINDLNTCNIWDLSSLINEYLLKLKKSNNQKNFDIYFQSFLMLINSINTLCILDQVNTYRKKLIPQIISTIRHWLEFITLNQDKFEFLSKENINSLNHYIWLLWINFSHSDYYYKEQVCIEDLTKEYYNIAKRQIKWFQSSKDSNYWNNLSKEKNINRVFLWNFAFWLSLLIHKSKVFWEEELIKNSNFIEILKILWNYFGEETKFLNYSIDELKNLCNNVFSWFFYNEKPEEFIVNQKSIDNVILDFTNTDIENEDWVIESIHNLVLFNNFSPEKLFQLWNYLLSIPPYNNYSFEFYKLKILDLIIEQLSKNENDNLNFKLSQKVLDYVDKNKTASQLLYAYSSLYLSISYSLSLQKNELNQSLAVNTFIKFLKFNKNMNWVKLKYNLDDIYYNLWSFRVISILGESGLSYYDVKSEDVIKVWKAFIENWITNYDTQLNSKIKDKLWIILNEAIDENISIDDTYLFDKLSNLISIEIFYWLAKIRIIETFDSIAYQQKNNWSTIKKIKLWDKHELVFNYPSIYKDIFDKIFDSKISEIEQSVNQVMNAYYSKMNSIYQDRLTWLFNESRLRIILNNINNSSSFINLKISNLDEINWSYWKEVWDTYLKDIANFLNLSSFSFDWDVSVFKLSWSKFWILLSNPDDIQPFVEKIKSYKPNINWKVFSLIWTFWVVINEKTEILEKSNIALLNAKEEHSKYSQYSHEALKDKQRAEIFDYLWALDDALEKGNVLTYFQPIKDLKTWEIYKYEALMRVKSWDKIDSPYMYLQAASKYSRLWKIAEINVENVFSYANINNERQFSLNLSWEDFLNEWLYEFIIKALTRFSKVNPSNITFEILESEWSNYDKIRDSIILYKQLWFKIWIDDYWAEHSNIHRLNTLLDESIPDFVKIDWSLVKRLNSWKMHQEQSAKADIENIVKKAQIYWFKIIAEYIEDEKLEEKVKFMWIDYAQWYHIWKPNNNLDILK